MPLPARRRATGPRPALPSRPSDGHKGTFGTVLVVGGCAGGRGAATMLGAPVLAARGALRAGAGLARLIMPAPLLHHALSAMPEATGLALPTGSGGGLQARAADLLSRAIADAGDRAVVLLGPGLGAAGPLLAPALTSHRLVLDADGLNALAQAISGAAAARRSVLASLRHSAARGNPVVLTPHPGEFRRLWIAAGLGGTPLDTPDARQRAARALAGALRAVVVLKGPGTVVAHPGADGVPEGSWANPTGNSALATAGTGDVLAGAIAGLMAQGLGAAQAGRAGAWAHGRAAELWVRDRSPGRAAGLLAHEVADLLPAALGELGGAKPKQLTGRAGVRRRGQPDRRKE